MVLAEAAESRRMECYRASDFIHSQHPKSPSPSGPLSLRCKWSFCPRDVPLVLGDGRGEGMVGDSRGALGTWLLSLEEGQEPLEPGKPEPAESWF